MESGIKLHHTHDEVKAEFSKRLKIRVKERGLSQTKLQIALEQRNQPVSLDVIKKWYGGKCLPRIYTLLDLCEILDCSPDYFFGFIDESTRGFSYIKEETGLDETAVRNIKAFPQSSDVLNFLFNKENAIHTKAVLEHICNYISQNKTDDECALEIIKLQRRLALFRESAKPKIRRLF